MSDVFMIADAQGDGSVGAPRTVARWQTPRMDVLCRVVRANLAPCLNAAIMGPPPAFTLYADTFPQMPAFCVAVAQFPEAWDNDISGSSFHPNEQRLLPQLRANDPSVLKTLCKKYAVTLVQAINNANLGFTIGTTHPIQDIATAMQGFTFTTNPVLAGALRNRYVARLAGNLVGNEPNGLLDATGKWNPTTMVAYVDNLDALVPSAPENLIHYLYELAGAIALAVSGAF